MAKLKPPYIENILTPFIIENDTATFRIPFTLSRSVHRSEVAGAAIIIKNAINNKEIVNTATAPEITFESDNVSGTLNFSISKSDLTDSQNWFISGYHYKIQIALLRLLEGEIKETGFYSSVGISKCIERPFLSFEGVVDESGKYIVTPQYEYTAKCELKEQSEKVAIYKFDLIEKSGIINLTDVNNIEYTQEEIIFSTGWKAHDSSNDEGNISQDTCYLTKTLDFSKKYLLRYSIITINGYEDSTIVYFESTDSVNVSFKNYLLVAEPDYENGTIIIKLNRKDITQPFTPLTYNFVLLRASEEDNYSSWTRLSDMGTNEEKGDFELQNALLVGNSMILWEDFTVEHGVSYKYALQAYNSFDFFSNRIESNLEEVVTETGLPKYDKNGKLLYNSVPTKIYFDDMYLSDGVRQLRIQFNPKVSSFKNTILETKVDTIGSQYPFFFRNGTVKYKEFPLSGLISLLMDPHDKFKVGLYNIKTGVGTSQLNGTITDLTNDNIKNERKFKLEVLDWLTNGQPKIFRSPTEGNYLVRLMNTSLSPNDTLGRMLHTFSCTAYEMDAYTMENLDKYGFINFTLPQYKYASFIGEKSFEIKDYMDKDSPPVMYIPNAFFARIVESYPIKAQYKLQYVSLNNETKIKEVIIRVGQNGTYEVPLYKDLRLQSISWYKGESSQNETWNEYKKLYEDQYINAHFKVQYGYYDLTNLTNFHFISNIKPSTRLVQHIGQLEYTDINAFEMNPDINEPLFPEPSPIATWGVREIGPLYWIRIKRRPLAPMFYKSTDVVLNNKKVDLDATTLYFNESCTDKWERDGDITKHKQPLMSALYKIYSVQFNADRTRIVKDTGRVLDFNEPQKKMTVYSGDGGVASMEITSLFTEVPSYEVHNKDFYRFQFNNESKYFTMGYANSNEDNSYIKGFTGTNFELDTTLLVNTPLSYLRLSRGLIVELCYQCKDLVYDFSNNTSTSENDLPYWIQKFINTGNLGATNEQISNLQKEWNKYSSLEKRFRTAETEYLEFFDNIPEEGETEDVDTIPNRKTYLARREKYEEAWKRYVTSLRKIIWYLTKDQEVVIE